MGNLLDSCGCDSKHDEVVKVFGGAPAEQHTLQTIVDVMKSRLDDDLVQLHCCNTLHKKLQLTPHVETDTAQLIVATVHEMIKRHRTHPKLAKLGCQLLKAVLGCVDAGDKADLR